MIYKTLHRKLKDGPRKIKQFCFHMEQPLYYSCYKLGDKWLTWEQSFIYFVVLTTILR